MAGIKCSRRSRRDRQLPASAISNANDGRAMVRFVGAQVIGQRPTGRINRVAQIVLRRNIPPFHGVASSDLCRDVHGLPVAGERSALIRS